MKKLHNSNITIEDVAEFLQVDHEYEARIINSILLTSIEWCEQVTGRSLRERTIPKPSVIDKLDNQLLVPHNIVDNEVHYTISDKADALKLPILLYTHALFHSDPKSIDIYMDAALRATRVHRINMGF